MIWSFCEKLHSINVPIVLQSGAVSAFVVISIPLAATCEHGRKLEIYIMGSIFCNFQNASPHKSSAHFPRNCTQLIYHILLQSNAVTASVLISIPLALTCEHSRKLEIYIMGSIFGNLLIASPQSALFIFRETQPN